MKLRHYQQAAVDAVYRHLRIRDDNPCVVIPTGGGKTPIIATLCRDTVQRWAGRVLVLAHVKELLEQSAATLRRVAPELDVGVYSAGLKRRDTDQSVIVAGIQSVYKRACELDAFDLILVDEAHLLPPDGEGMYRQFLADAKTISPYVRLIGLTVTPFRLKSGMLCGPDNLLNEVCYEIGVKQLIDEGFLCPLKTRAGSRKADFTGLKQRGGEFLKSEVTSLVDTDELVGSACREIVRLTGDRNTVLFFAASVEHAQHVKAELHSITGQEIGLVTGDTPPVDRAELLARFKGERVRSNLFGDSRQQLKYLVNINVLTTGFDAPNVDCVVLLRPTASPGLFYQAVGRGFRLHPDKQDCLVLDYGDNILRHGPVDAIELKTKNANGNSEAPAKECPKCHTIVHAAILLCPECSYCFPRPERSQHDVRASNAGILTGQFTDTRYEVRDVFYHVHEKKNAKPGDRPTLRVDYQVGLNDWQSEWVCFEHTGYARRKAIAWWSNRSPDPVPDTAQRAVEIAQGGGIATAKTITVRSQAGQRFDRIIAVELDAMPDPIDVDVVSVIDEEEIPF